MNLIAFVQNYEDLSTDRGYQFKFFCDKCGNGHMTSFQASVLGTAGSLLRAAGNVFGWAHSAGDSAYEIQRAIGGSAHDAALRSAVEEAKPNFHQCVRCSQWVCPHPCWNAQASLCTQCAPDFQVELASAHAQAKADAMRAQLQEKAAQTDFVGDISMARNAVIGAPFAPPAQPQQLPTPAGSPALPARAAACCLACGGDTRGGKFCPDCGAAVQPARLRCKACGHEDERPSKFCSGCGAKMGGLAGTTT